MKHGTIKTKQKKNVDILLVPVISVILASAKRDRMAIENMCLMNKGGTSHKPKFVMRLRHPLCNFRINTAPTKQDSVSAVQRMQLQTYI